MKNEPPYGARRECRRRALRPPATQPQTARYGGSAKVRSAHPTARRGIVRRPAAGIGLFPRGAVAAHAAQQSVGRLRTALRQGGIAGLARVPPIAHRRGHRPLGEEGIDGHSVHRPTRGASSPLGERHILRRRQHIAHRRVHILRSRGRGPFGKERIEERRGRGQVGERHRPLSTRHRPTREVGYPTRGAGRPLGEGRISRRRGRLDQFAVCVERK